MPRTNSKTRISKIASPLVNFLFESCDIGIGWKLCFEIFQFLANFFLCSQSDLHGAV